MALKSSVGQSPEAGEAVAASAESAPPTAALSTVRVLKYCAHLGRSCRRLGTRNVQLQAAGHVQSDCDSHHGSSRAGASCGG